MYWIFWRVIEALRDSGVRPWRNRTRITSIKNDYRLFGSTLPHILLHPLLVETKNLWVHRLLYTSYSTYNTWERLCDWCWCNAECPLGLQSALSSPPYRWKWNGKQNMRWMWWLYSFILQSELLRRWLYR